MSEKIFSLKLITFQNLGTPDYGGALYFNKVDSSIFIEHCLATSCSAAIQGGAICISGSLNASVKYACYKANICKAATSFTIAENSNTQTGNLKVMYTSESLSQNTDFLSAFGGSGIGSFQKSNVSSSQTTTSPWHLYGSPTTFEISLFSF